MRRWAKRILLIASTLLAVTAAVVWVRSYWGTETVGFQVWPSHEGTTVSYRVLMLMTHPGRAGIVSYRRSESVPARELKATLDVARMEAGFGYGGPVTPPVRPAADWMLLGFYAESTHSGAGRFTWDQFEIGVPYWFLTIAGSIAPAVWLRRWRQRPRAGHCQTCGYDLTGNVSGVCPECGQATAPAVHKGAEN